MEPAPAWPIWSPVSLFLVAMFFSPLASMIGGGVEVVGADGSGPFIRYPALAPALIVVGSLMLKVIRDLDWDDPTEYVPAFLIVIGIPLTFSIAHGIAFGFISYSVAKLATGRLARVPSPDLSVRRALRGAVLASVIRHQKGNSNGTAMTMVTSTTTVSKAPTLR